MTKFVVAKTIDLSSLGSDWENCYIKVNSFTIGEIEKLAKVSADETKASGLILSLISDKFIEGKGFDGSKVVPIKKDDIPNLPIEVITKIITQLTGDISKKK